MKPSETIHIENVMLCACSANMQRFWHSIDKILVRVFVSEKEEKTNYLFTMKQLMKYVASEPVVKLQKKKKKLK